MSRFGSPKLYVVFNVPTNADPLRENWQTHRGCLSIIDRIRLAAVGV